MHSQHNKKLVWTNLILVQSSANWWGVNNLFRLKMLNIHVTKDYTRETTNIKELKQQSSTVIDDELTCYAEWSDNIPHIYCLLVLLYLSNSMWNILHASSYTTHLQNLDLVLKNSSWSSPFPLNSTSLSHILKRLLKSIFASSAPSWGKCRSHLIHCKESSLLSWITATILYTSMKLELFLIILIIFQKVAFWLSIRVSEWGSSRTSAEPNFAATKQAFLKIGLQLAVSLIATCKRNTERILIVLASELVMESDNSFSFSCQQWRATWAKPSHLEYSWSWS